MRCNNCGKEIEEYETFCDECKKILKNSSSREEVKELERLIEEQKKLNDLDATKVLEDLENLVAEKLEEENDKETLDGLTKQIDLENIIQVTNDEIKEPVEDKKIESREELKKEENELKTKKNRKKLIIIISSVVIALILIVVLILIFKPKNKDSESKIDYKKIINDYGKSVEKLVATHMTDNEDVPTWNDISSEIKYKDYKVVCSVHDIYKDGNIYLDKCKVDGKSTKYTYGKKQENKETIKLTIYESNGTYNTESGREVGIITCKTEACSTKEIYDTYSIVKEDDGDYIYNYKEDILVFGPFKFDDKLARGSNLYGVMYRENGQNNIYSLVSNKSLKNINGSLYLGTGNELNVLYKYSYVILKSSNKYNFVSLKTGNVSYSITGTSLGIFNEDSKNNLVNIIAYNGKKVKLYNSNGKALLDGEEFDSYGEYNGNYLFKSGTNYLICDSKLNTKFNSKKYDKTLGVYKDYIVVIDKNHLEILDTNGGLLAKFEDEWNTNYEYKEALSGWSTYENKYGLYLTVENKSIPGYTRKYYYIKDTKEKGVIEIGKNDNNSNPTDNKEDDNSNNLNSSDSSDSDEDVSTN